MQLEKDFAEHAGEELYIYIYIYMYVYVYMYINVCVYLSLSLYIYIYIYICTQHDYKKQCQRIHIFKQTYNKQPPNKKETTRHRINTT